jgi:hypothetical protein
MPRKKYIRVAGLPFALKHLTKGMHYPREECCVQSCGTSTMVVDASHNFSEEDLPLCDKHWEVRAKL